MSDWSTIASLSTAGGHAGARRRHLRLGALGQPGGARVRGGGPDPPPSLLVPSRLGEPDEKVGFKDEKWFRVPGGGAIAEVGDNAIYLVISLRNVGNGIAVLDRWCVYAERLLGDTEHGDPATFRRLTRDLYVPPADRGFWQGALRDPSDPLFDPVREAIKDRQPFTVELLYGDYEGGQRMITRFSTGFVSATTTAGSGDSRPGTGTPIHRDPPCNAYILDQHSFARDDDLAPNAAAAVRPISSTASSVRNGP